MTDGTWCPKHLRTIGALAPCELCAREAQGCNDCILPQDSCAYFNKVAALEKEVERLRKDAERYRYVCKHGFPNRHRNDAGELYWTYYDGTSWNSCHAAIDAQLAAMRTGEGA